MKGIIVSTDRLITASEARNKFGKLLDEISKNSKNYFVILDNGKVAGLLVAPDWLRDRDEVDYPDLETLRQEWDRYTQDISDAMDNIIATDSNDLPALLK
ncbi:hypothetical protein HYW82_00105 [Candidatus Peregrinibacteria bacterium]|nr:hypothetical protein [Candidatus Peregrinibacteria bacterium]